METKSKTQMETKHKGSNWDQTQNSFCDKTKKVELLPNPKTQIVMKLRNSNFDKSQKLIL